MKLHKCAGFSKKVKGNKKKYFSFKEAFARINAAIKSDFYLEAITIEESIICDRLMSYLYYKNALKLNSHDVVKGKASLNNLLQQFHKICSQNISCGGVTDLYGELDAWRKMRNKCIHSIVKSYPGKPTENINNFLEDACIAALKGKKLCRILSDWCAKERKKAI